MEALKNRKIKGYSPKLEEDEELLMDSEESMDEDEREEQDLAPSVKEKSGAGVKIEIGVSPQNEMLGGLEEESGESLGAEEDDGMEVMFGKNPSEREMSEIASNDKPRSILERAKKMMLEKKK